MFSWFAPSWRGIALDASSVLLATAAVGRARRQPWLRLGLAAVAALLFAVWIDWAAGASLAVVYPAVRRFLGGPIAAPGFALVFGWIAAFDR
jgi:hypothetical protein